MEHTKQKIIEALREAYPDKAAAVVQETWEHSSGTKTDVYRVSVVGNKDDKCVTGISENLFTAFADAREKARVLFGGGE